MGADLEPLSGVAGEVIVREESGDDGGNSGAVFKKPVALQDAGRRRRRWRRRGRIGFGGKERDLGEIWESESVDRRLLGVEVFGESGVEVGTAYYGD